MTLIDPPARWTFGGGTPESFDDHAKAHIPMYSQGHELILSLSDFFASTKSIVDIGCSTGTLTAALAARHGDRCEVLGIDVEATMVESANRKLHGSGMVIVEDVRNVELPPADLVVSYYTLQFIPPADRLNVLRRIHNALRIGGAFVWFEKTRSADSLTEEIRAQLYSDYKRKSGLTAEQILAKTRSLRGVLTPLTSHQNDELLAEAGFATTEVVQELHGFRGILAIREDR